MNEAPRSVQLSCEPLVQGTSNHVTTVSREFVAYKGNEATAFS